MNIITLYQVISSWGSYDDFRQSTEGIYSTPELAQTCVDIVTSNNNIIQGMPCPINGLKHLSDIGTVEEYAIQEELIELLSEEDYVTYYDWVYQMDLAMNFNSCDIHEITLDKLPDKI